MAQVEKNGTLDVKLLNGVGLPVRDGGKEPEYVCRLRIAKPHPTPEHDIPRTAGVKGSPDPQFNKQFQLVVKQADQAQLEILIWDVSPMTETPQGKEIFIGDVLVNVGKLIDYAGETIKWPFEIRKRTQLGIESHGKLNVSMVYDQEVNVDLYMEYAFASLQNETNKRQFEEVLSENFSKALAAEGASTLPKDRFELVGMRSWEERGESKGTNVQFKLLPPSLASEDRRSVKALRTAVSGLKFGELPGASNNTLNATKNVLFDNAPLVETKKMPAALTASFQVKDSNPTSVQLPQQAQPPRQAVSSAAPPPQAASTAQADAAAAAAEQRAKEEEERKRKETEELARKETEAASAAALAKLQAEGEAARLKAEAEERERLEKEAKERAVQQESEKAALEREKLAAKERDEAAAKEREQREAKEREQAARDAQAARQAALKAADGSGVKLRMTLASDIREVKDIGKFKEAVCQDVAAAAGLDAAQVSFDELDVSEGDPTQTFAVDTTIASGADTKAVVSKLATDDGKPTAELKSTARTHTSKATKAICTILGSKSLPAASLPASVKAPEAAPAPAAQAAFPLQSAPPKTEAPPPAPTAAPEAPKADVAPNVPKGGQAVKLTMVLDMSVMDVTKKFKKEIEQDVASVSGGTVAFEAIDTTDVDPLQTIVASCRIYPKKDGAEKVEDIVDRVMYAGKPTTAFSAGKWTKKMTSASTTVIGKEPPAPPAPLKTVDSLPQTRLPPSDPGAYVWGQPSNLTTYLKVKLFLVVAFAEITKDITAFTDFMTSEVAKLGGVRGSDVEVVGIEPGVDSDMSACHVAVHRFTMESSDLEQKMVSWASGVRADSFTGKKP